MNIMFISTFVIGGILGDAFGKLFSTIWDGITWVGSLIWDAVSWIGSLLWDVITWIGDLLRNLFQSLIDLLVGFFEVIYALIDGLLYLLYKIGVLAVKLFQIFLETGKLLISFVRGILNTLQSLTYTPATSSGNGYSEMIGKIFTVLEPLQINVIAYILLFILWISTAFAAVRILSSLRAGGSE